MSKSSFQNVFCAWVPIEVLPLVHKLVPNQTGSSVGTYVASLIIADAEKKGVSAPEYKDWIRDRWRVVNNRPGISMGGTAPTGRKKATEPAPKETKAPPPSKKPKRETFDSPTTATKPRIKRETF